MPGYEKEFFPHNPDWTFLFPFLFIIFHQNKDWPQEKISKRQEYTLNKIYYSQNCALHFHTGFLFVK
jgi:hypothetical protein